MVLVWLTPRVRCSSESGEDQRMHESPILIASWRHGLHLQLLSLRESLGMVDALVHFGVHQPP